MRRARRLMRVADVLYFETTSANANDVTNDDRTTGPIAGDSAVNRRATADPTPRVLSTAQLLGRVVR